MQNRLTSVGIDGCCPIEVSKIEETESSLEDPSQKGKESGKTVWPLADICDVLKIGKTL